MSDSFRTYQEVLRQQRLAQQQAEQAKANAERAARIAAAKRS